MRIMRTLGGTVLRIPTLAAIKREERDRRILKALEDKGPRGSYAAVARRFRLDRRTIIRRAHR